MKIYVAGKTHDYMIVRGLQLVCQQNGHTITSDWTQAVERHGVEHETELPTPEQQASYAQADINAVAEADLVIMLYHEDWLGSLIELGAALGLGKRVWIIGEPKRISVFWHHPNIEWLEGPLRHRLQKEAA